MFPSVSMCGRSVVWYPHGVADHRLCTRSPEAADHRYTGHGCEATKALKTTTPTEGQYAGDLVSNAGKREMGPKCRSLPRNAGELAGLVTMALCLAYIVRMIPEKTLSSFNGIDDKKSYRSGVHNGRGRTSVERGLYLDLLPRSTKR